MNNVLLLLGLVVFLSACSRKKLGLISTPVPATPAEPGTANIPIFLLDGQSNMTGDGDPTIVPLGADIIWRGTPGPKGIGVAFAQDYLRRTNRPQVIMIQAAVGGTYIREHLPGTPIFNNAVDLVQRAIAEFPTAKVAGILFYQGESDAIPGTPDWGPQFLQAMRGYRHAFGDDHIPVVFCQIDETAWPTSFPYWAEIQTQQAATTLDNAAMVTTSDIRDMADQVHLSAIGLATVGDRMAQAYFGLLN